LKESSFFIFEVHLREHHWKALTPRIFVEEHMASTKPYSQINPAPWKHPSELAMLRDWLYPERIPRSFFDFASSTVDRRQDAINIISLWRFRDPKLSHVLISTAHLTDAILHDQQGKRDALSSIALRSIYAMTFCRFVNALVDRDVRKSVTATIAKDNFAVDSDTGSGPRRGQSSMYAHALELGLPESFVELRHQAIHEEMPSLEVLRVNTREALDWLWERWWKVNVKGSAQPALGEWEERHREWQEITGQLGADEEDGQADVLALCRRCRKRKQSEWETDDGNGASCEDEAEKNSRNLDRPKQPKMDVSEENQGPPLPKQQGWLLHLS
jgi:Las1-like